MFPPVPAVLRLSVRVCPMGRLGDNFGESARLVRSLAWPRCRVVMLAVRMYPARERIGISCSRRARCPARYCYASALPPCMSPDRFCVIWRHSGRVTPRMHLLTGTGESRPSEHFSDAVARSSGRLVEI